MPRVLTIAGVDPCGGAGLTADSRTIQALGAHALTVPTCWTDQDRTGFRGARAIDESTLATMLAAVARDGAIDAVKTGLFASSRTVDSVARFLDRHARGVPLIVDPVLSATAGGGPIGAEAVAAAIVGQLASRGAILTPNHEELAQLSAAGTDDLLAVGARAVLVTGGDAAGDEVVDELWTSAGRVAIRHPRVPAGPVHGTGCALSSALAVELARGSDPERACRRAIERVATWIAATRPAGDGLPVPLRIG